MTLRSGVVGHWPRSGVGLTTAVLVGALWVQRQRQAWPFVGAPQHASGADSAAAAGTWRVWT